MALSLRPFGGIYNPFSKGCSVLCNHPAPAEVKQVISKCKQSLVSEERNKLFCPHNFIGKSLDVVPRPLRARIYNLFRIPLVQIKPLKNLIRLPITYPKTYFGVILIPIPDL